MLQVAGYRMIEPLGDSASGTVFIAAPDASGKGVPDRVVVKLVTRADGVEGALAQREYQLQKRVSSDHVPRPLAVLPAREGHVIVTELAPGLTLRDILAGYGPTLSLLDKVDIAAQVAQALGDVHAARVVHKDVNPANIVWQVEARKVWLIDFGLADELIGEGSDNLRTASLEGTLAYIAPEQSGRVGRTVDHRADFYALGATLFELFAGRPPFVGEDAMDLLHQHLAQPAPRVDAVASDVPEVLGDIVARLLAKDPEDRYQSAFGLRTDLLRVRAALARTGEAFSFALGRDDRAALLRVPRKLYGRAAQVATVLDKFNQVANGERALLFVGGPSGVGKTAVVAEVLKPITGRRGLFARGKFDQYQRERPYAALLDALEEVLAGILASDEAELAAWRAALLRAVGEQGRVLTDVLAGLSRVLGPQPEVTELGAVEAQNRFRFVLTQLIGALADPAHPLVLFLDDLQWADTASLALIEALGRDRGSGYLMIIGAYRDRKIEAGHPLDDVMQGLERAGAPIDRMILQGLEVEDVARMLADTFRCAVSETADLAALLHRNTAGNPYFLNQFIQQFDAERLIRFDPKTGRWVWDIEQIRRSALAENVVDLLTERLSNLPKEVADALAAAACIGAQFDLNSLCAALGSADPAAAATMILPAVKNDLLVPIDESFRILRWTAHANPAAVGAMRLRFRHDRVQQAAYEAIAPSKRPYVHLAVGRHLMAGLGADPPAERLFAVVGHFEAAREQLTAAERAALRRFALAAGHRARNAAAYRPARRYFELALSVAGDAPWQTDPALARTAHIGLAEALLLSGELEAAKARVETYLAQVEDPIDRTAAHLLLIEIATAQQQPDDGLRVGLIALRELGFDLPIRPHIVRLLAEMGQTAMALAQYRGGSVTALPDMTDARLAAAMQIFGSLDSIAYTANPPMLFLITAYLVRLTLKAGIHPASCTGFALYAQLKVQRDGPSRAVQRWAAVARELAERPDSRQYRAKIGMIVSHFVDAWYQPQRAVVDALGANARIGLEVGDHRYAAINAHVRITDAVMMGAPLEPLQEQVEDAVTLVRRLDQDISDNILRPFHQFIVNMRGPAETAHLMTGPFCDEAPFVEDNKASRNGAAVGGLRILRLWACLLMRQLHAAEPLLDMGRAARYFRQSHHNLIYSAFSNLVLLQRIGAPLAPGARVSVGKAIKAERTLHRAARTQPEVFAHIANLLKAERLRVLGKLARAKLAYDLAAGQAVEAGRHADEGLVRELFGRAHLAAGNDVDARLQLTAAMEAYGRWGGAAKVAQLRAEFTWLAPAGPELTSLPTSTGRADALIDMTAVLRAGEALAEAVQLQDALTVIMRTVLASAGAQWGALVREVDGTWMIEARATADEETVQVLNDRPATAGDLPLSMLHFASRAETPLVFANASEETRYAADPYVARHKPLSVAVIPLSVQGRLRGLVYLQNDLSAGAFADQRVELVRLLSGQMAVTLENARLYQDLNKVNAELADLNRGLEDKVASRTEELSIKTAMLTNTFDNMTDGLTVVSAGGILLDANRRAQEIWGLPPDFLVEGLHHVEMWRNVTRRGLLTEASEAVLWQTMRKFESGSTETIDTELTTTDGRYIRTLVGQMDNGQWLALFTDMTEIRAREHELVDARRTAETANLEKSRFLATMSHEIRTPMNGVLGMLEVLGESALQPRQDEMVDTIRESAGTLLRVIDDILDFSKIEAGKLELEDTAMSLSAMIEAAADVLAPRAHGKGLELITHVAPGTPDGLLGDPVRLRQVVINLVGNAVKFTETGGVRVWARDTGRGRLRIEVSDTGIGLTEQQRAKLFQPFVQADTSTTRRFGGTGLGLSICQHLIEAMQGEIGVDSTDGVGSTFWFEIPLRIDPTGTAAALVDVTGLTVLIADCSPFARAAIAETLSDHGTIVETAGTMAELQARHDMGDPVDVVLLRQPFDGVDVLAAAPRLLGSGAFDAAGAVLIVAAPQSELEARAAEVGFDGVLVHPTRRAAVLRRVAVAAGLEVRVSESRTGSAVERYAVPAREVAERARAVVLVAEDNPTNQLVIRRQMEHLGLVVDIVEDGVQALALLSAPDGHPYGMVLTDCHMPILDGYQLTAKWRAAEIDGATRLPILALSANAAAGEAQKALDAGMDDYLTKPIELARLDGAVRHWLPAAADLRVPVEEHAAAAPTAAPATPPVPTPSAAPSDAPASDANVLDLAMVEMIFGEIDDDARAMMRHFLATTGPTVDDLMAAEPDDLATMRALAHRAAGAARTAGANALGEALTGIEDAVMADDAEAALRWRDRLPPLFAAVTEAIQAL